MIRVYLDTNVLVMGILEKYGWNKIIVRRGAGPHNHRRHRRRREPFEPRRRDMEIPARDKH